METTYIPISSVEPKELQYYVLSECGTKESFVLFRYLEKLEDSYPEFREWYFEKVAKEVVDDIIRREVIIAISKEQENGELNLSGIAILKDTDEKKICTILVDDAYRNQGIGSGLFEESFRYLGTRKPLITVSERRIEEFRSLFEKYDFECTSIVADCYIAGEREYLYNERSL